MSPEEPRAARAAWEPWLFAALVAVTLVPFWAVARVPTLDGPSHLYNAWIVKRLARPGGDPWLARVFEIDWRPLPNWLGHALLALLMVPFPPAVAEKVLVSGYAALLLYGARYLAGAVDPERRWLALLAFPLVFNQSFQLGFYNYVLSLGCFPWAVGWWWRRRERPGLRMALGLNAILILCFLSHLVGTVLALFAIGVLWLVTLRASNWRRHLLHVPILLPPVLLLLWYLPGRGAPAGTAANLGGLWLYLRRIGTLYNFDERQLRLGALLAAGFALLALATVLGRLRRDPASGRPRLALRAEDGFPLLAALLVALYFLSPDDMADGALIKMRLTIYPWLVILPWLAPPLGRAGKAAAVAVLALLAVGNAAAHVHWYRIADRDVEAVLAAARGIEPRTRILPLVYDDHSSIGPMPLLGHAIDRAAIDRQLIDWSNYEAATDHFPVRFRPELHRPDTYVVFGAPDRLRIRPFREQIDYVFCWKMPPGSPQAERLLGPYALVAEEGPARLYERRTRVRARQHPAFGRRDGRPRSGRHRRPRGPRRHPPGQAAGVSRTLP